MPAIPTYILKKLYVARSLRNVEKGCQFQIKNTLAPATLTAVGPVTIDGVTYGLEAVTLSSGSEPIPAHEVSRVRPLPFDLNVTMTVTVAGVTLAPGEHRLGVGVNTKEAGRLTIELTDVLAE